jgi:hypothetical protein
MDRIVNVYCDESCHLENDGHGVMVLGGVWCPGEKAREINRRLREIVSKRCRQRDFEFKWKKVSPAGLGLYLELFDYFFDDDDLHFRVLVVPDKSLLDHEAFGQSHEDWYYKMYFRMLEGILDPEARTRIYLDYKDTQGGKKARMLHQVLCNSMLDFSQEVIERLQVVQSNEVPLIQLTDLLVGAVGYANRGLKSSSAKSALVERAKQRSHYSLTRTTLLRERKFNILRWRPKEYDRA